MTLQDIRHGARVLAKSPGLTCAAVVSLGLALGANTTVFTLINAVFLKPLPVAKPEELVLFSVIGGDESFSYPLYEDFREQAATLSGILASGGVNRMRLAVSRADGGQDIETVYGQPVSGNFFSVLGVEAIEGRALREDDDRGGDAPGVVVLSERYWMRRFGRDPAIVGRAVVLDQVPVTIVGIAPAGFAGIQVGSNPDLWWPVRMLPMMRPESKVLLQPGNSWLVLIGRLAPTATRAEATAEMDVVFQRYQEERARVRAAADPGQPRNFPSQVLQLRTGNRGWTHLRPRFTRPLLILMVLVAIVLLVACVNIANLRLVSGIARQQELAMRVALGATRRRVVGQLVTESLLLAVGGGLLGLAASVWATRVLITYLPVQPGALSITPDGRVLAFTFAITLATGIVFGAAPAFRAARISALRQAVVRTGTSDALIVMQFALCVSLLVGAGLFARTLQNLRSEELGFVPAGLTVFALDVPTTYDADRRLALYERVRERLATLPEVRSASFSFFGLLGGSGWTERIEVTRNVDPGGDDTAAQGVLVSSSFFETLGAPLLRGRELRPDGSDRDRSAVINESMARRYFPGRDPVGDTFRIRGWSSGPFEVVGVVPDSKYRTLRDRPAPTFYVHPSARAQLVSDVRFEVRAAGPATELPPIGRVVSQIDPDVQVVELTTMGAVVDFVLVQERLVANLASALGFLALLLAAVGLYGVTAYTVARRTSEIGIRMAVGARRGDILRLVLRRSSAATALGIALGLAGAAGIARYVEAMLFGVTPIDPMTFAAVALVFGATVMLAAFLPARRATKVDPLLALRCE